LTTLIIPSIWEVEIGGSKFKTSPGQKLGRPYLKNKPDMLVHACNSSHKGDIGRRITVQGQPGQKE
jgi:hypothetical protein